MAWCCPAVRMYPEKKKLRGFCVWGLVIVVFSLTRVSWGLMWCARRKKWNENTVVKMWV